MPVKTSKLTCKAIGITALLLLLGGCTLPSPIKDLECTILSANAEDNFMVGEKDKYTLNANTGEYYDTDELSGKLLLLNGRTSDIDEVYDTRALIVNNEWKMEMVITYTPKSQNRNEPYKTLVILNLKTMEIEEKGYSYSSSGSYGDWEESSFSKGKCKWVKPKTTEILQEPKT